MDFSRVVMEGGGGKTVGCITFESELAPLGGLAAVMRVLPQSFSRSPGWCSFILASFFSHHYSVHTRCKPEFYDAIQTTGQEFLLSIEITAMKSKCFNLWGIPIVPLFLLILQDF